MTVAINNLAEILQTLFTTEADTAAKESGIIQRRRKIYGDGYVQTLVCGWLEDPTTTVDELGDKLNVSKQGLDQHFGRPRRRLPLAGRPEGVALARRHRSRDHSTAAAVHQRGDE